jgi:hypothetical protein
MRIASIKRWRRWIRSREQPNVALGSKAKKLNAMRCFPLSPENEHRATRSASPLRVNSDADPIFDHLGGSGKDRIRVNVFFELGAPGLYRTDPSCAQVAKSRQNNRRAYVRPV